MMSNVRRQKGIRAAIEPIRSAEVSLVHTISDAKAYLDAVSHPGVGHINGDVYHMQVEESHIGETLVKSGPRLTNLHLADSNRCALGDGSLDLDTIIMALYVIGYNQPGCYVTPEPLGPGGDPVSAQSEGEGSVQRQGTQLAAVDSHGDSRRTGQFQGGGAYLGRVAQAAQNPGDDQNPQKGAGLLRVCV